MPSPPEPPRAGPIVACLIALLLAPLPARAAPRVALDAAPPPPDIGCPEPDALRADVAALLGRDPFDPAAPRRFVVRWASSPDRLTAEITVVEGGAVRGARRLESGPADCPALHRAVGLMLAVALDPLRLAEPLPAGVIAPEPVAAGDAADATDAIAPKDATDAPDVIAPKDATDATDATANAAPPDADDPSDAAEPAPLTVEATAALRATVGVTPAVSGAAALGVAARGALLGVGAELWGVWPSSTPHRDGEVRAGLVALGVRGCASVAAVEGCALALGGWQRAWGSGFDRTASLDAPYVAVGGRVAVTVAAWGGWRLRPVVELIAPLTETRLLVGGEVAWQTPALNGAVGLELAGW